MSGSKKAGSGGVAPLDRIEEGWLLLARVTNQPRMHQAVIAEAGLTLPQSGYPVLGFLDARGPMRIQDLADGLGLDGSTISRQIVPLEKSGLLERKRDRSDGRATLLGV